MRSACAPDTIGRKASSMAKAGTGNGNDPIRRNRALLTQAAATRSYTLLLFDEAGEAVLRAYSARLRAGDLLWRRWVAAQRCWITPPATPP